MRRWGNLWPAITSEENLHLAYRRAKRGKADQPGVITFAQEPEWRLARIRRMLLDGSFHTSRYHTHTIWEPKERLIHALPFDPDRVVHHALMNELAPRWTSLFINESYACIPGRGPHAASQKCMEFTRRYRYCLQSDISKFYPSIDHAATKRIIRRKLKDPDVLWLLDDIIDSCPGGKGLPIGNLSSQWLGNLYLNEVDQFVKHFLRVPAYVRYCDDFLLFADSKLHLRICRAALTAFCREELGLRFSKSEVFPVAHGIDFLGYRHFPQGYIMLRRSTAKRIRRKIEAPGLAAQDPEYRRSLLASVHGWIKHANCHHFAQAIGLYERQAEFAQGGTA